MDGRNSCGIPQSKVGTCCIYFTPPSCPKGVSRKCSGSHVAISYSCITYQSRLQPEKAITEFKPFAFVHSHSSLMKSLGNCHYHPLQKEKKRKPTPQSVSLLLDNVCSHKGKGGVALMTWARVIFGAQQPDLVQKSFHTLQAALDLCCEASGYEHTKNY